MKLVLALLGLLAVAKCAVADGCEREDADRCTNIIVDQLTSGNSQLCGALTEARTCLLAIMDRCLSDAARNDVNIQQHLNELNERVESTCANEEINGNNLNLDKIDTSGVSDEEREMLKCVADEEKLTTYVGQCLELALDDIRNGRVRFGSRMADNNCQIYLSIARCVAEKVGDVCGEPVKEPFFHGMMIGLKTEDARTAASQQCANAISAAEAFMSNVENKRKRRSVENVRFSKLIP